MRKNDLLSDITILDFTYRLPGPFASKVLTDLGAKVIKIESPAPFDDPFNSGEIERIAPNFRDWYKNLAEGKDIQHLSQSEETGSIQTLINSSDVILIPKSKYFKEFNKDFNIKDKIIVELAAGKGEHSSLHDLTVLALNKSFATHAEMSDFPPYLPFGGIAFAQYISTYIVSALLRRDYGTHTLYMSEIVPELFSYLDYSSLTPQKRVLHTGLYPAYGLYRSKDGKVLALAAMEEKFWMRFIECFKLALSAEDRFDTTSRTRQILEKRFSKLTSNEIQEIITNKEICLTIN